MNSLNLDWEKTPIAENSAGHKDDLNHVGEVQEVVTEVKASYTLSAVDNSGWRRMTPGAGGLAKHEAPRCLVGKQLDYMSGVNY